MTGVDRGVTSTVSYTLTVAMAMLLVTGLVVAGSNHVGDQRTATTEAQMDVIAHQVAGNLEAADRLVRAEADQDPATLVLDRHIPEQILESSYTVSVSSSTVMVSSPNSDGSVNVEHQSETPVDDSSFDGGRITIEYLSGDGKLVVRDG